MPLSRRDLAMLLPALAAAQSSPAPALPSKVYHPGAYATDPNVGDSTMGTPTKKGRALMRGAEHSGFGLEVHETVLGPGTATHAPHKHVHDEMMFIIEGTAEALIEGKAERAESGSLVFYASNQMHNLRNTGTTPCRYLVVELRGKPA